MWSGLVVLVVVFSVALLYGVVTLYMRMEDEIFRRGGWKRIYQLRWVLVTIVLWIMLAMGFRHQ